MLELAPARWLSVIALLTSVALAGCRAEAHPPEQRAGALATQPAGASRAPLCPPAPPVPAELRCDPATGGSSTHDVGPGQKHAALADVPWGSLHPGDVVRVHWRAQPYRELLLLSDRGTAQRPIRICGVAGPNGERPVLSGAGARTARPDAMTREWNDLAVVLINRGARDSWTDYAPEHLILQGLRLEGAAPAVHFQAADGGDRTFFDGSACISILRGAHLVLQDNELAGCGNGLFVKSTPHPPERVTDLIIRGNHFVANNVGHIDGVHNAYVQAFDVLYEFNHFASPLGGNNLKDRSVGATIRYNWFEAAPAHDLDLVEAEEHREVAVTDPRYQTTAVYGNVIEQTFGGAPVHYGADHLSASDVPFFRTGTLYFYNNTLLLKDAPGATRPWAQSLFVVTTVDAHVALANNIIDYQGNAKFFDLMGIKEVHAHLEQGGSFDLGVNFLPRGWNRNVKDDDPYYVKDLGLRLGADGELGVLRGADRTLTSPSPPLDRATLRPRGPLTRAGEALSPPWVPPGLPLEWEYDRQVGDPRHPLTQRRPRTDRGLALGALQDCTVSTTP